MPKNMADLTFTTIEESARAELGLSRDEYALCNYVQTWSSYPSNKRPGYCGSTKGQMAVFIGISPRGIMKMLDRMERVELIERLSETLFFHRITKRWFDTVTIAKAVRKGEQSSSLGDNRKENKVPLRGEQSSSLGENKVLPPKEVNNKEVKERDAPAEIQNPSTLKEEISKRDVAPPGDDANKLVESFRKAGAKTRHDASHFPPGPMANATDEEVNELVDRSRRETKEIHAAFSKSKTANRTFEDAEKEIAVWAATDGIETVKHRYDLARRKFNEKDLPQLAAHFCSIYGVPGGSNREQLLRDPIEFFRVGLNKYLTNQNQFDRSATGQQSAPGGQNNQTRYSQTTRSQTTHFGGDADKFNQKPLF